MSEKPRWLTNTTRAEAERLIADIKRIRPHAVIRVGEPDCENDAELMIRYGMVGVWDHGDQQERMAT